MLKVDTETIKESCEGALANPSDYNPLHFFEKAHITTEIPTSWIETANNWITTDYADVDVELADLCDATPGDPAAVAGVIDLTDMSDEVQPMVIDPAAGGSAQVESINPTPVQLSNLPPLSHATTIQGMMSEMFEDGWGTRKYSGDVPGSILQSNNTVPVVSADPSSSSSSGPYFMPLGLNAHNIADDTAGLGDAAFDLDGENVDEFDWDAAIDEFEL